MLLGCDAYGGAYETYIVVNADEQEVAIDLQRAPARLQDRRGSGSLEFC